MNLPNRARLRYWLTGNNSPTEQPEEVMRSLAAELGFTILGSVAQSAGEQWWFWISYKGALPALPGYIEEIDWLPVGTV